MLARRRAANLIVIAALLPFVSAYAQSLEYPARMGKIIAPYAPGGTYDALAREFSRAFTTSLGQSFIVENRPGAGGNVGMSALARAPADGYTLAIGSAGVLAINPWLYPSMPFDPLKDFSPIAFIGRVPFVLVVNASLPATNLKELIAYMKSSGKSFNYGSSGVGTVSHLFGEQFKRQTGVDMVHVPYKSSGQVLQEVVAGRLQLQFAPLVELMPQIQAKTVRAIAIAGPNRLPPLPDVPTLTELGMAGFESPTWFGILAPSGTPRAIVELLSKETAKAMGEPGLKARLAQAGVEPQAMTPEQFQQFIVDEYGRWKNIVQQSGARLE